MSVETYSISISTEQPEAAFASLRVLIEQILNSPQAKASQILSLRHLHRIIIIDRSVQRARYLADVVHHIGYQPILSSSSMEAFAQFLQGNFLPLAIAFGGEDTPDRLFLNRLLQQVVQKYRWDTPVIRFQMQAKVVPDPASPLPATTPVRPLVRQHTDSSLPSITQSLPPVSRGLRPPTRLVPSSAPGSEQPAPKTGSLSHGPAPVVERPTRTDSLQPLTPTPASSAARAVPAATYQSTRTQHPAAAQVPAASMPGLSVQEAVPEKKDIEKKSLEGQNLGRYQISNLIGGSPYTDVYHTYDRLRETHIALKAIQRNLLPDSFLKQATEDINPFQQELDMLTNFKHPHILSILNCGKSYISGYQFFYKTMPEYPGSLASWRFEHGMARPFTPHEVIPIILQLADALQYAHERDVLYQNFKLSNVLIQESKSDMDDLRVLLTDFALTFDSKPILRTPDSLRYLAPEQWEGQSLPASDQYGLAAIAYELLTGRPPFQGVQEQLLKHMHQTMPPRAPSAYNPTVSIALDNVILRALAKSPQERYPSMAEFARLLQLVTG